MTISRFLSFTGEGFGEGGEAKMKGIFMEVLKCFGIKMVSFGGNMSCLFLFRNQRFLSSAKNHRERLSLAFYAIVVARCAI